MAIPLTPSRFASSISGAQGQYNPNAPSLADTLPSVDFGFNDLRERMAAFTTRFDDFIERGRKRVLQERNAFRVNVAELEETQRARRQAIAQLEAQSHTHADTLEKEQQETEEMHEAIRNLSLQREEHLARRDQLKQDISATQTAIKQRKEAQSAHQRSLDAQARHNVPELKFWEQCLGLRIEGTGVDDTLRFVFVCIDERDAEKEVWFDLDMRGKEYEVVGTKPKLLQEDVEVVMEKLQDSRELGGFLKEMRALFVDALKQ